MGENLDGSSFCFMLENSPQKKYLFINPLHVCKVNVPVSLFKAYLGYKKQHMVVFVVFVMGWFFFLSNKRSSLSYDTFILWGLSA